MFCLSVTIFAIILVLNSVLTDKIDDLIKRRCNETLTKEKTDQCLKCYNDVPKLLKGLSE